MGLAIWDNAVNSVIFISALHTSSKLDFGSRARAIFKWIKQIYKEYPPTFLSIEDVDYRSRFVDRRAQSYLTAGLSIILASLPDEAGYILVNKRSLKKELNYTERKQGMKIFSIMQFLQKKDKEHIADSLSLLQYHIKKELTFKSVIYRMNIKPGVFQDVELRDF